MEFINKTDFNADILRATVSEHDILAGVVCKPTFRIVQGRLVPDTEDPWPVGPDAVKTPFGELDADTAFIRRGIDVIVAGNAYAPQGRPVQWLDVAVAVGSVLLRYVRVFGDRQWLDDGSGQPVMSAPVPFVSMPLTYEMAYGGEAEADAGKVPFGANPVGRGFHLTAEEALGKPLPNLEDPYHPITSWSDQPEPVGLGPYRREWSLRLLNSVVLREGDDPGIEKILPTYNNNAHPRLIIEDPRQLRIGDMVHVTNVRPDTPDGGLHFPLPDLRLHVHVQLEDRHCLYPMRPEQILILAEEARVVISYRVDFQYTVTPMERRFTTVRIGPAPDQVPDDYIIDPDAYEAAHDEYGADGASEDAVA